MGEASETILYEYKDKDRGFTKEGERDREKVRDRVCMSERVRERYSGFNMSAVSNVKI